MLIKRNVYFSAVDEETGEERLFSVNEIMTEEEYLERMYSEEQREFSSKAQKARRAKFDVSVAKEMYGETEGNTNDLDKLKRVGRRKAKQRTISRVKTKDGGSRLAYDYGIEDLSKNTKNAILDASKGKEKAVDEVGWRALLQKAGNADNPNSKKFKSAQKVLDKLDAIENRASRTAKLKTAGKIGLGAAALVGGGVVAKKIYDKRKKDDDNIKG